MSTFTGNDTISTAAGPDYVLGGAGNDTIDLGTGHDQSGIYSNGFVLKPHERELGNDVVRAGPGNDSIYDLGGRGRSRYIGGPGNDLIRPEGGSGTVDLGSGNDTLMAVFWWGVAYGGAGADRFHLSRVRAPRFIRINCGAGRDQVFSFGSIGNVGCEVTR